MRLASAGALGLAVLGAPGLAEAAGVDITVTLASPSVEVGESVYVQVEVESESGRIGVPRFRGLENVDVRTRGSTGGMSFAISGAGRVQRTTKTFIFALSPRKAGKYSIDVEVDVGGKVRRATSKPTLTATGDDLEPELPELADPPDSLETEGANDTPPAADAEVIVWPVVDKTKVYVGEQIVYELQIWEHVRAQLSVSSTPTFKNFWSEDLLPDNQTRRRAPTRRVLDRVEYRVHSTMRRALFPQKPGRLTIGGPEVQLQQISGPFFGGGGPPKTFAGRELAIEVMPLPSEDQPPGFRPNNVGSLRIKTEVDRTELRQGEAVRLSIHIAGTGNIALVELPPLPELDGLRSYEPKPQTPQLDFSKGKLEGARVYSMLLVADQAGELTIPAFELPHFDPEAGAYRVARSEPLSLTVEANPDAAPDSDQLDGADVGRGESEDDELLAPPIAGGELPRVTPRERWLSRERWWVGTVAAPTVLGLGWLGGKLLQRFGPDDQARARSREFGRRRVLLTEASAAVESGEQFYPKLATLLQATAVGRAGSEGVGLTRDRLMNLLTQRGVPPEEIDQLRALLDACDMARFGAGSGELEQRQAHLQEARALLRKHSWRPQ